MRREHINIIKDKIKRKYFLKKEIKFVILKSIFQNRYISTNTRIFIRSLICCSEKKHFISFQKKKCLITGQSKGIFKKFEISRHMIKNYNNMGLIQNLTTKKW